MAVGEGTTGTLGCKKGVRLHLLARDGAKNVDRLNWSSASAISVVGLSGS